MKYKTQPYKHQAEAVERSLLEPAYGFFMEMGTGKSKVLIDTISNLYLGGHINFALIIAPKGVYSNWPRKEIPDHFPEDVPHRVVQWVPNPNKAQEEEMRSISKPFDGLTLFVMNVEAFSSVRGVAAGEWLAKTFGAQGLIAVDESTTLKSHRAKRTKALTKIARGFAFRRILTGSPITNAPMDVYAQCEFLGPGLLGCDNYFVFQHRYAVVQKRKMGTHSFEQVVGYRNLEDLGRRMDRFTYRVLKKDCLDLPERTFSARYVSLTDEQARMYGQLRRQAMTILEDELVTAPMAMTQMLRLQQVLSGHLKTDEGELHTFKSHRLDTLMEILEEAAGKVIVWSRFRQDIVQITEEIRKVYGRASAESYFGDTEQDVRERVVRDFQDPTHPLRFFVGNPATAGYGLTLTEANLVVYYANSFSLEQRLQSQDRVHRIGQKNPVTYIDLIAEGTIDEKIVDALRNKIDLGAKVLREEAQEWLKLKPKTK